MKLVGEKQKEEDFGLEVGDVVVMNNTPYILMESHEDRKKYEFRGFDGVSGACGTKDMEFMREYVRKNGYRIYNSRKYELFLRKKV